MEKSVQRKLFLKTPEKSFPLNSMLPEKAKNHNKR